MEQANGENTENLVEQFSTILTTLTAFRTQITTLQNQVKVLEKNVKKQMKTYEKEAKKHKNKGNRKASGFAVGGPVSKELCNNKIPIRKHSIEDNKVELLSKQNREINDLYKIIDEISSKMNY